MLKPDFSFIHEAVIEEFKGVSGSGKPIYAEPVTMKCRIQPRIKRITDAKGNEVVAGGRIMFTAGTRLSTGTKITYESRTYELITLAPAFSMSESHVEGWFK